MENVLYKNNSTLDSKVVLTHDGSTEYRVNCKKIKGQYYLIDDCIEVAGAWYSKKSNVIIFDHFTKKWILKIKAINMMYGIVDFENGDKPILGYFTPSLCDNVTVINYATGRDYICISGDLAAKFCKEDVSSGKYYLNVTGSLASSLSVIKNKVDNKQKGYNIEDNVQEMQQKITEYNNFHTKISRSVMRFSSLLKDTSFGIEYECIKGYLPDYIQYRNGIVVCRDGSLHDEDGSQGPEFTTIPLQGAKGVQSTIDVCKALTQRTIIDKHCALHIHLGNLPTSRIFLVSLYKLAYMIQDEIFQMFPYYKIDEKKYAGKDKNYCKKLSKMSIFGLKKNNRDAYNNHVDDNYCRIFSWLSGGEVPSKQYNRKLKIHPKGNEKWSKTARYCWINFMNVVFSNRNTLEFRIHQGTTNPQKVVTWLFICNAIVKTAMNRAADILAGKKITLNDVLDYYAINNKSQISSYMSQYLKEYVRVRKQYFKNDYDNGNYMSEKELMEDKNFTFPYPSVSEMFV